MNAAPALVAAFAVVTVGFWRAFGTMFQEEAQTRISKLPELILILAVHRLPRELQADLGGEWAAELDFIVSETEGLPLTRLLRGLDFAADLLLAASKIASELTGSPRPRTVRTVWTVLLLLASTSLAFIGGYGFADRHTRADGVLSVIGALAFLLTVAVLHTRTKRCQFLVLLLGLIALAIFISLLANGGSVSIAEAVAVWLAPVPASVTALLSKRGMEESV